MKYLRYAAVFVVVFMAGYMGLCLLVPGFRIKLAADFSVYLRESISHMAGVKTLLSSLFAGFFTAVTAYVNREEKSF